MPKVQSLFLTAGVLTVLLGSSTVATRAAQQDPMVLCMKPGTGLVRIILAREECKANETRFGFEDFPLFVALRNRIITLETQVDDLTKRVEELEMCVPTGAECGEKK